ncbi:MAG: DNA mismatch repair endonuclease MutL, partial [Desulfobulbales bacterium]
MSKIKILSEHLANQIAAGEVIERPASVVKELLENSIDADASHVQIEIEGSGTRLIRVIDDGVGMDADDALLCLERHATSKLAESSDDGNRLAAIRSLGFRGEAIPSIASVAKMSITSRIENDPLGTRIELRYGKLLKVY